MFFNSSGSWPGPSSPLCVWARKNSSCATKRAFRWRLFSLRSAASVQNVNGLARSDGSTCASSPAGAAKKSYTSSPRCLSNRSSLIAKGSCTLLASMTETCWTNSARGMDLMRLKARTWHLSMRSQRLDNVLAAGDRSFCNREKHSVSRLSYLFAHLYLLSSYSFSSDLLSSNLPLLFASALLCFSSVHIVGSLTSKLPSLKNRHYPHNIPIMYPHVYIHSLYIGLIYARYLMAPLKQLCLILTRSWRAYWIFWINLRPRPSRRLASESLWRDIIYTWWIIPLSKRVITPAISGLTLLIPLRYDYHLVMTNIANWKIPYKWRFIAGKIIYKWAIFHGYVK